MARELRLLLSSRRCVPCLPKTVDITVKTRFPGKWAVVDMETGELWAHDGLRFARLSSEKKREVADVVNMPMSIAGT
jgi:hypothetical protein